MTKVDQFESAFRAADKPVFEFLQPVVERALVVTDLRGADATAFRDQVRDFLAVLGNGVQWDLDDGDSFKTIEALLECMNEQTSFARIATYIVKLGAGRTAWASTSMF